MEPPAKRPKKLLDDSESEDSSDENGGVPLTNGTSCAGSSGFKINENYARRFEHNKKREELHQLEEKLGKSGPSGKRKHSNDAASEESDESSTDSDDEDDEGLLATEALDAEISSTLQAIRSKDPRVYDTSTTFYTQIEDRPDANPGPGKKEKPIYLRDYHRQNLLNGNVENDEDEAEHERPMSYAQEQADLKNNIVKQIHAAADEGLSSSSGSDDDTSGDGGFLVPKVNGVPSSGDPKLNEKGGQLDVESADKDPETFLSNFMAYRAWVPSGGSRFQPFESDDEEDDRRAEEFEEAYNFRFEDPSKANEKLTSHARDTTSKYSVRRDEPNSRRKKRDTEREKKEAAKKQLDEEEARLRKLRIEELEEKVKKIKGAAGLRGEDIDENDWGKFLDDGWDDAKWEREMQARFGDAYYAEDDIGSVDKAEAGPAHKKRKLKKPKWEDDIDIKDLVPDFQEEEVADFSLSEEDENPLERDDVGSDAHVKSKKGKNHAQTRKDSRREARKERRKIEQIVDDQLETDPALLAASSKQPTPFRYRETSPLSYGLTARDILMAEDSQLNQYAGLKKLASFREAEKKRKDKKKLGKKARLRQWRKEMFGSEFEPQIKSSSILGPSQDTPNAPESNRNGEGVDIREGKKKRRRVKRESERIVVDSP